MKQQASGWIPVAIATAAFVMGGAIQPLRAEVLERTKKVSGTTVQYKVVLPNGYDPGKAYPGIIALGILTTFITALVLAVTVRGRDASGAVFFTVWILFCGLILGLMIELTFALAWKAAILTRMGWLRLLPGTAAIAVFGGAIAYLLKVLAAGVSFSFALTLALFLVVNLAWGPRLKRKTPLGRQVSDQIAGFRQFLQRVEQDQLNRLNPSAQAPSDLDHLVPYAIALELKDAWGDHLSQTFFASTVVAED